MALSERQRQKKLERRNRKRKERHRGLIKEKNRGLSEQLALASAAPIVHCCITDSFWDAGIANVLISRELPRHNVAYAFILVDRYCLGVKDATGRVVPRGDYNAVYEKFAQQSPIVSLPPPDLRALIEDAIEFARQIGFEPHRDYRKIQPILGDIDASAASQRFEFGDDNGKPHFVAGPSDDPLRCREILRHLEHTCGPEGYHFTLPNL